MGPVIREDVFPCQLFPILVSGRSSVAELADIFISWSAVRFECQGGFLSVSADAVVTVREELSQDCQGGLVALEDTTSVIVRKDIDGPVVFYRLLSTW